MAVCRAGRPALLRPTDEPLHLPHYPQFYGVHASSVARRGMMEYLHISKAGGTSFSEVASRYGMSRKLLYARILPPSWCYR